MAGLLDTLNNPLFGLAAGLLSGGDPGGTLGGGLSSGLQNMLGMQQASTQNTLLTEKIKELQETRKREEERRKAYKGVLGTEGTPNTPYQMSPAEMFPGESPIQGLLNQGQDPTGMYAQDPGMAGLLNMMGPDLGPQFMGQVALQQMKPADDRTPAELLAYQQMYGPDEGFRRWEASKTTQNSVDPYYNPIYTPEGVISFNARTGQAEPLTIGGKPVVGAQYSPDLQGQIAGAKTTGESKAKRDSTMSGIGSIIDEARSVLSGDADPVTGEKGATPTGSVTGAAIDTVGGWFGATPEGAKEADRLKAIGGALVAKMPRMEGPQSNFDVQNYREMAGQVGDSTIPVPRRLAALAEVERLWRKYDKAPGEDLKTGQIQRQGQSPVRRFNPQTGMIE